VWDTFENWEAGHARPHVPRYKQTFQYRPYVYVLSGDLPFQHDDELFVIRSLHFEGCLATTYHQSEEFDIYTCVYIYT
jgi:hypothetical protein